MKKLISLLLALVMVLSLCACSNDNAEQPTEGEKENVTTNVPEKEDEKPAEIPTVSILTFTDWYKSGWEALEAYIDERRTRTCEVCNRRSA